MFEESENTVQYAQEPNPDQEGLNEEETNVNKQVEVAAQIQSNQSQESADVTELPNIKKGQRTCSLTGKGKSTSRCQNKT